MELSEDGSTKFKGILSVILDDEWEVGKEQWAYGDRQLVKGKKMDE